MGSFYAAVICYAPVKKYLQICEKCPMCIKKSLYIHTLSDWTGLLILAPVVDLGGTSGIIQMI